MSGDQLPGISGVIPDPPEDAIYESVRFIPSHLTRAMVAGGLGMALMAYAKYEMRRVTLEEVEAFLRW